MRPEDRNNYLKMNTEIIHRPTPCRHPYTLYHMTASTHIQHTWWPKSAPSDKWFCRILKTDVIVGVQQGSMTSSALQISISVSVPSFYGCIELHGNWLPIYWRQSASPIQYIFANFYLPPTHVNVMKAWCVVVVEEYSSFGVVRCLRCSPSRRCCCLGHTPWWCRLDGIFTCVCHLCASDIYM